MVFYRDYNLLIYPESTLRSLLTIEEVDLESSSSNKSSSSEDDLSNIEEIPRNISLSY